MVEKTYEALDLLLLNASQQALRDFADYLGIAKDEIEDLNKQKLLKKLRDLIDVALDKNSDVDNVRNLTDWLGFLRRGTTPEDENERRDDTNLRTSVDPSDSGPDNSGHTQSGPQVLNSNPASDNSASGPQNQPAEDINAKIAAIKQKYESMLANQLSEIQGILSASGGEVSQQPTNKKPSIQTSRDHQWPLSGPQSMNSLFRRELKIHGQINEQEKGDQLSFVSLSRQIESAIEKGYTAKEVVEAVLKAMKPGMKLRSYLETLHDLTLPRLRQILRSHYKEKSGTLLYQELATIFQAQKESPESFLLRALDLRQKILFASQEADANLKYDPKLVQGMFLRSLETGLRDDNILAKLRPILHKEKISDEELIQQMNLISSSEQERQARIGKKSTSIQANSVTAKDARHDGTSKGDVKITTRGAEANILAAVEAMQVQINSLQEKLTNTTRKNDNFTIHPKQIQDSQQQQTTMQQNENRATLRACKNCVERKIEASCRHCNYCMGENHFARDCLKRQADNKQRQGNGRGLRQGDKA